VTSESAATVAEVLDAATRRLREAGVPDPRRDAAVLLAQVLGTDRGGIIARKPDLVPAATRSRFAELITLRAGRKPLQHLEGFVEFRGRRFEVNSDVLIPRPETEDLVQAVLDAGLPEPVRVADLGTGSGCIAVALAVERSTWRLVAVDLSEAALRVAARNATRHGVAERVTFVKRDFGSVPEPERGGYAVVVSNPPYISDLEWEGLQPEVRDHEPRLALVSGPSGNEAYQVVSRAGAALLRPGGLLAVELGWTSEEAVRRIVADADYQDIIVRPDGSGIPRVLTARR
jgi:release factor glutamine methyltransferase